MGLAEVVHSLAIQRPPGDGVSLPKDTYPSKDDVASYLGSYVSTLDLPVRLNAKVTSLTKPEGGYVVTTANEQFTAGQVVVATGPFQVPFVPPVARGHRRHGLPDP